MKYIKLSLFTLTLLLVLFLSKYTIGFESLFVLLIFFVYFSSFHYLLYKKFKCPDTLSPIVAISFIVIFLHISGIFGSLHIAFYILLSIGIVGIILMFLEKKFRFYEFFILQPQSILLYYLIAILLYIQAYYLHNNLYFIDDIHHWAIIAKGVFHYHRLTDFPRITLYDSYTMGQALFSYFINRLSSQQFSVHLMYWSVALISAASLIPVLAFFRNQFSSFDLLLLLISFTLFCFDNVFFIVLGIVLIIFVITDIYMSNRVYKSMLLKKYSYLFSLASFFLLYAALALFPEYYYSNYISLKPDHLIAVITLSTVIAFLARPTLRSFFWIIPVLALPYIFKRPGIFFSVIAFILIIVSFLLLKFKIILFSLKNKNNRFAYLFVIALLLSLSSLLLPPLSWSRYLMSTGVEKGVINSMTFDYIKNCFFDNSDPVFFRTRDSFTHILFNDDLYNAKLNGTGIISPAEHVVKFFNINLSKFFKVRLINSSSVNYIQYLILFIILQFISFVFLFKVKALRFLYILSFFLFAFLFLNISGLLVNYCYWFGNTIERYKCPCFQRYSAPMIKFVIAISFLYFILITIRSKNVIKAFLLSIISLFLSLCISNYIGLSRHVFKHDESFDCSSILNAIPSDYNFLNKDVLVIGNAITDKAIDYLAPMLVHYKNSIPKWVEYANKKDNISDDFLDKFDCICWLQEDSYESFNDLTNSIPVHFSKRIKNIKDLDSTCIFERDSSCNNFILKFKDAHVLSNIVFNGDFKLGFKCWEFKETPSLISKGYNYLVIKPNQDARVAQKLHLCSNTYYRVFSKVSGNFGPGCCLKLGNEYFFKQKRRDECDNVFYSNKDQDVYLVILNGRSESKFANIKVIDLGQKNRND